MYGRFWKKFHVLIANSLGSFVRLAAMLK